MRHRIIETRRRELEDAGQGDPLADHPLIVEARGTVESMSADQRDQLAALAQDRPDMISPELARLLGL